MCVMSDLKLAKRLASLMSLSIDCGKSENACWLRIMTDGQEVYASLQMCQEKFQGNCSHWR
jgi:hypothetical protein